MQAVSGRLFALAVAVLLAGSLAFPQESKPIVAANAGLVEASSVTPEAFPIYVNWLNKNGKAPIAYMVEKAKQHQVVFLGEYHMKSDFLQLLNRAIPELYRAAGVRVIALEVCNAEDDQKLTKLVNGSSYDRALALEIARSENWEIWGYKDYWDILEAAWRLNHSLPKKAERMRVIGVDKRMDFQLDSLWRSKLLTDEALIEKAKNQPDIYKRDDWMVQAIEDGIIRPGLKGVVLIGMNHSFTKYAQPSVKEGKLTKTWARTANVLHQKYGDKIFQIAAHGEQMRPEVADPSYKGTGPVLPDLIEKIMAARGNQPVGFDVEGSPFARLRDSDSYYFRWQPEVSLADVNQGLIFLKPMKDLASTPWVDGFISEEMFKKSKVYYETTYQRKFNNAKEVDDFFKAALATP